MEIIDGRVYIMRGELDNSVSVNTLKSLAYRKKALTIKHPEDRRILLHEFNALPTSIKDQFKVNHFGGREPIEILRFNQLIEATNCSTPDSTTSQFFEEEFFGKFKKSELEQLLKAEKLCKFLITMNAAKIKSCGYTLASDFWDLVLRHINKNELPLPRCYSELIKKLNRFKSDGVKVFISKKAGNKNSAKIESPEQIAYIQKLYSLHNQFTSTQIAFHYNLEAVKRNWSPITDRTVRRTVTKFKNHLAGARHGNGEYRKRNDVSVSRTRPSAPNLLWVSDGWTFEAYFQERITDSKGNTKVTFQNRLVIYMVIDAFNDCIVGYDIGRTETNQLAKNAWANACIQEGVLPHQVKTDNYGRKEMTPFYEGIARTPDFYTPAAIGNAQDKVIEQAFSKFRSSLVRYLPSYSGANITAKEQQHKEKLAKQKHSFPTLEELVDQIEACVNRWNTMCYKGQAKGRMEHRNAAVNCKDRVLSTFQRLSLFGREHGRTCTLINKGLDITLGGIKRTYFTDPDNITETDRFVDTIGTTYKVTFDPDDFSTILVQSLDGKACFVLFEKQKIPMALSDFKNGDRSQLNKYLNLRNRTENRRVELLDTIDKTLSEADLLDNFSEGNRGLIKQSFAIGGDEKQTLNMAENAAKAFIEPVYHKGHSFSESKKADNDTPFRTIYDIDSTPIKPIED